MNPTPDTLLMRWRPLVWCALGAVLALLSACATLDENQCRSADWRQIGRADGEQGHAMSRLDEHRKACAEYRIQPDADRYWLGRSEGLNRYCRLDNAVRAGLAGRAYHGVCPPDVDPAFRRVHAAGLAVAQARQQIATLDSQIDSAERDLRRSGLSDRDRVRLRDQIRDLDRRRDRLRDDLRDSERRFDRVLADHGLRP